MGNMSYCRFENTLHDLRDCFRAMENGEGDELSESERAARVELLKLCRKIANAGFEELEPSNFSGICRNSMGPGVQYPREFKGHWIHANDERCRFEVRETADPASDLFFSARSPEDAEEAISEVVEDV